MLRYHFDTDHLTLYQHGHPLGIRRLGLQPAASVGISVVVVEETLRGRLAHLARSGDGAARIRHYALLEQALVDFTQFPVVSYDQAAEDEFQKLRAIRVGARDLRIAATAVANRLIVVTRNRCDFARVPGLVIEDWSV